MARSSRDEVPHGRQATTARPAHQPRRPRNPNPAECQDKAGPSSPMAPNHPPPAPKKYFPPEQAEAMLPLVRSIVKDISDLAHSTRDRHERLTRLQKGGV